MTTESRRPAVTVVVVGGVVGAAMILAMQAFREPLRDWLVENPSQTASRARGLRLLAAVLAAAAVLLTVILWRLTIVLTR